MVRYYLILFLLCSSVLCTAQNGLSVQGSIFTGKSITHADKRTVEETWHKGFSLEINKASKANRYWAYAHDYPQMGLILTARSLGNNDVYGYAFSFLPYLEFDLLRMKHARLQIKHGTGLAVVTKQYNEQTNPQNQMLSTKINASSIIDLGLRWQSDAMADVKLGFIVHHISNGGFQAPNSGFNTASAYVNGTFYLNKWEKQIDMFTPVLHYKKTRFRLGSAFGFYTKAITKEVVINPQLSALVLRQHNTRFRTGLGIEGGNPYGFDPQLAIYLEEEVQFSKLVTKYGLGAYVLNRRFPNERMYSKIGIAYYPFTKNHIPEKFFVGLMMKAHDFTAIHIEICLGYTF